MCLWQDVHCAFPIFGLIELAAVELDLVFLLAWLFVGLFLTGLGRTSIIDYDVGTVPKIQFAEFKSFLNCWNN